VTGDERAELELLTPAEVAALFHVSVRTIWRRIASGELPTVSYGGHRRIPADAARRIARGEPATVVAQPQPIRRSTP